jgi:hypothetical protein
MHDIRSQIKLIEADIRDAYFDADRLTPIDESQAILVPLAKPASTSTESRRRGLIAVERRIPLVRCWLHVRGVDAVHLKDDDGIGIYSVGSLDFDEERSTLSIRTNQSLVVEFVFRNASPEIELEADGTAVGFVKITSVPLLGEHERVESLQF